MTFLLHHALDRAADRSPQHPAFVAPTGGATFAELAARANQLARLLIEQGVRRGDRVGINLPRGLESPLAVYGVLKAGATFVPLDPQAPTAATQRLVESCGIRHVIAAPSRATAMGELAAEENSGLAAVIGLDAAPGPGVRGVPWSALDAFEPTDPAVPTLDGDVAYIMFSSGSTGRPKGIAHSHRSGLAYARGAAALYAIGPDDRIASHSALHFDMSTLAYFSAPWAGATTVVIPEAYTKLAASLSQLIEAQAVSIWYSVPLALIQLLLRGVLEARDHRSIRWVLYGGEPFPVKHLRALMARWPHARFSNVYGPAEVNQCTYYHLPPLGEETGDPDAAIPIGSVWDYAEGIVVDADDQPVPDGEPGELLIRSATMMRGYWDRPDLNARAFHRRASPTGDDDLFYRTGDLVRSRADGQLLILGRKDRQLKVRGYRVEMDDVEHALTGHAAVEEAAVFKVRSDQGDHVRAAALIRAEASVDSETLRRYLAERLSWYAVPQRIDLPSALPRTSTGKIDRRRLQQDAEQELAS